jgi:hypothetical protein
MHTESGLFCIMTHMLRTLMRTVMQDSSLFTLKLLRTRKMQGYQQLSKRTAPTGGITVFDIEMNCTIYPLITQPFRRFGLSSTGPYNKLI